MKEESDKKEQIDPKSKSYTGRNSPSKRSDKIDIKYDFKDFIIV